MKEIKLKIEGMHCAECSNRLEKILNNVDGIESAKVSLEEKSADIKYNEEEVELNTILQEIEDAGFKGDYYLVVDVANDSETKEKYVVYRRLYGDGSLWIRPLYMFLSEVDHNKYPNVKQKYRFELQEIESVAK